MATAQNNLSQYNKATIPDAGKYRFGIVVSEWNANITQNLCKGAISTLVEHGVSESAIVKWNVPGSFELIYGCKLLLEQTPPFDAIIAIGDVIQGETRHFDFVCQGVTQGIKDLNIAYNTPVILCVLTDNTLQQSIDRSGGKYGNKGVEAAIAAIKMAKLRADNL